MSNWYEVIFDRDELPIDSTVSADFLEKVSEIYHQSGSPTDFAVFKDFIKDGLEIYYLTPIASDSCRRLLLKHNGTTCQNPSLTKEFIIFGDFNLLD